MLVRLPSPLPLGRFSHPTFDELEVFADGAGGPGLPNGASNCTFDETRNGEPAAAARVRRRRVAQHLARCTRCQRDVRTWRTLRDAMAAPVSPAAPGDEPDPILTDALVEIWGRLELRKAA